MSDTPLFDWVPPTAPLKARFDGAVYDPERDDAAWTDQMGRVFGLMRDQRWRTIAEIANVTRDPHASVSAQLRHLRKGRFGGFNVQRQRRMGTVRLYEYRVLPPDPMAGKVSRTNSVRVIQHLREELKLLRSAANAAADLLEEFDMDGSEGHRVELVAQKLRERAAGMEPMGGGVR